MRSARPRFTSRAAPKHLQRNSHSAAPVRPANPCRIRRTVRPSRPLAAGSAEPIFLSSPSARARFTASAPTFSHRLEHFIDEGNLGGDKCGGRFPHQFGSLVTGHNHRNAPHHQRMEDLLHAQHGIVGARAQHDPVRPIEVFDRASRSEKHGLRNHGRRQLRVLQPLLDRASRCQPTPG